MDVVLAGGQENSTAVQTPYFDWVQREADPNVIAKVPAAYVPMLQTTEAVAERHGITREAQNLYGLESQRRTTRARRRFARS